jgi:hypothetical protein
MKTFFGIFFFATTAFCEDFIAERPDAPDNAITIDKDDFYLESELLSHQKSSQEKNLQLMQLTARYGLSDKVEGLLSWAGLSQPQEKEGNRPNSIGNLSARLRVSHWGKTQGAVFQMSSIWGIDQALSDQDTIKQKHYLGLPLAWDFNENWYWATTVAYQKMHFQKTNSPGQSVFIASALYWTRDELDVFVQVYGDQAPKGEAVRNFYQGVGIAYRMTPTFQGDIYWNKRQSGQGVKDIVSVGVCRKF